MHIIQISYIFNLLSVKTKSHILKSFCVFLCYWLYVNLMLFYSWISKAFDIINSIIMKLVHQKFFESNYLLYMKWMYTCYFFVVGFLSSYSTLFVFSCTLLFSFRFISFFTLSSTSFGLHLSSGECSLFTHASLLPVLHFCPESLCLSSKSWLSHHCLREDSWISNLDYISLSVRMSFSTLYFKEGTISIANMEKNPSKAKSLSLKNKRVRRRKSRRRWRRMGTI